jgi:hypothetical protein
MRIALRLALLAPLVALLPAPVLGQQARPQKLGDFQSWTAAAYGERAQRICYAFARASRHGVLLTVTHRPGSRDEVTISAGYTYPRNAEATVTVGGTDLAFYTAGSTAAARDGAVAARAFRNGREAGLKGPAATGRGTQSDSFPLAGFTAAYDAISRECPRR